MTQLFSGIWRTDGSVWLSCLVVSGGRVDLCDSVV